MYCLIFKQILMIFSVYEFYELLLDYKPAKILWLRQFFLFFLAHFESNITLLLFMYFEQSFNREHYSGLNCLFFEKCTDFFSMLLTCVNKYYLFLNILISLC